MGLLDRFKALKARPIPAQGGRSLAGVCGPPGQVALVTDVMVVRALKARPIIHALPQTLDTCEIVPGIGRAFSASQTPTARPIDARSATTSERKSNSYQTCADAILSQPKSCPCTLSLSLGLVQSRTISSMVLPVAPTSPRMRSIATSSSTQNASHRASRSTARPAWRRWATGSAQPAWSSAWSMC